jgi:hypothetical protein
MKMRGIAAGPCYYVSKEGQLVSTWGGVSAEYLKTCALYFDYVVLGNLKSEVFSIGMNPEMQSFYKDIGIAGFVDVPFINPSAYEEPVDFSSILAADLNANNEDWHWSAYGPTESTPTSSLPGDDKKVVEVSLYNALPKLGENCEWADILEFKERRRDELLALRHSLDAMYLSIIESADIPRAQNFYIDQVGQSLSDLRQTEQESRLGAKYTGAMKVKLNVGSIAGGALAGAAGAMPLGLNPAIGALAGAVASVINFEVESKGKTVPSELGAYRYLLLAESELKRK